MRKFGPGVAERLGFYVYRLVDPRNGETFYVGKGTKDRVFDHINEAPSLADNSEKRKRITSIRSDGMEPLHVIHRHGLESEDAAMLVESVLMDAYPGLTNATRGQGANDYGPASVETLESRYAPRRAGETDIGQTGLKKAAGAGRGQRRSRDSQTDEIPLDSPVVTIKITDNVLTERAHDVYETVRRSWIIGPERLMMLRAKPHHVLAILKGKCVGAYFVKAGAWRVNRDWKGDRPRCMFEGEVASEENQEKYIGKHYSDRSQTPVRAHGF